MLLEKVFCLIKEGKMLQKCYRKFFCHVLEPVFSKCIIVFPIKSNRVLFDNFGGKGYGDNPRYIAEELHCQDESIELVWFVDNCAHFEFPDYIKPIKIDSIKGLYMRATSKVWVDNVRHLHPVKKKKNQIYIQTWHAPFSPKYLEGDAEERLGKKYIKQAKYDGSICNAILANSKLQEEQYKRAFWLNDNTEILRFGLPRNDYLANSDLVEYARIRKANKFEDDKVYILYAPTFRDDMSIEGYNLDYDGVLSAFEKLTGKQCIIVVRLHPNVSNQVSLIDFRDNVINGTNISNMQELSIGCDYIISDYSTSLFDFVLLKKPAFICALDLERYKKLRGLLPEFDEFPFPMATTNTELIEIVENFDLVEYQDKINAYFQKYPIYDKGYAAIKTGLWIINKINANKK